MESFVLADLADQHLAAARADASGRSVHIIHAGPAQVLREVLAGMVAGGGLPEHDNPGEAILHVVTGRVRLNAHRESGDESWEGGVGECVVIPPGRHSVDAIDDAVILVSQVTLAG